MEEGGKKSYWYKRHVGSRIRLGQFSVIAHLGKTNWVIYFFLAQPNHHVPHNRTKVFACAPPKGLGLGLVQQSSLHRPYLMQLQYSTENEGAVAGQALGREASQEKLCKGCTSGDIWQGATEVTKLILKWVKKPTVKWLATCIRW